MLLYQYACACGQPVISGLPLQHAQGALLLSCELRRLRCSRCLSRCLRRCLSRCLRRRLRWRLNRRLWLALWGSRLSRHVLLRFVLAPRGPAPPFRFRRSVPAQRVAQRVPAQRAPLAPPPLVRSAPFNYTWSRYNTNDKDDPRSRTTLPSRSVRRKRMCLRVTGPLSAMKCPSSEPVSTMVPTLQRDLGEDVVAQVAQHSAGVGQLGAAQVDLVGAIILRNSKTCCPPETKLGPSMLKGLVGEAAGAEG